MTSDRCIQIDQEPFFNIRGLVEQIRAKIAPFNIRTTTFVAMNRQPEEVDSISDHSLQLWSDPPDMRVREWIPEFYEHPTLEPDMRRRFVGIAQGLLDARNTDDVSDDDLLVLHDYLVGVVLGDARRSAQPLLYWFLTVESSLRSNWSRVDTGLKPELLKQTKTMDAERLGFGELSYVLTAWATKVSGESFPAANEVIGKARDLRNNVVHGKAVNSLLVDWQRHCETLLDYLRLHTRLVRLIAKDSQAPA